MTPRQIELVQSSFERVLPIADKAAEIFYARLFQLDPSLRPMFRGDMKRQGKKLMDSIRMVVANLRSLDRVVAGVRAMGERHAGYGVKDHHYATVGTALIETLSAGLGDLFTREVSDAWLKAYTILAETMKIAAAEYATREEALVS
jgi:hemoglobin-like flavoprotein